MLRERTAWSAEWSGWVKGLIRAEQNGVKAWCCLSCVLGVDGPGQAGLGWETGPCWDLLMGKAVSLAGLSERNQSLADSRLERVRECQLHRASVEGHGRQVAVSDMGHHQGIIGGGVALHSVLRELIRSQMVGGSHTGIPDPRSCILWSWGQTKGAADARGHPVGDASGAVYEAGGLSGLP